MWTSIKLGLTLAFVTPTGRMTWRQTTPDTKSVKVWLLLATDNIIDLYLSTYLETRRRRRTEQAQAQAPDPVDDEPALGINFDSPPSSPTPSRSGSVTGSQRSTPPRSTPPRPMPPRPTPPRPRSRATASRARYFLSLPHSSACTNIAAYLQVFSAQSPPTRCPERPRPGPAATRVGAEKARDGTEKARRRSPVGAEEAGDGTETSWRTAQARAAGKRCDGDCQWTYPVFSATC